MRKRQLTLLGSLLCVLALTACNVEVNIDGDINANIDTSIDLGDDTGEDGDGNENIPTEITLSLTASAVEVTVGDSVDISFSTSPAGVSVTFSSSDTSLATVTNNGHVTTLAPGTVTITAVASLEGYNDVSKSIVITINPVIDEGGDTGSGGGGEPGGNEPGDEPGDEPGGSTDVTTYGVEITNGASLTPLEIGETKTVSVSLLTYTNDEETDREIATADDVTLSSSESGVLSINGLEITALDAGETILTATWTEKGVQSSGVSITVNTASSEDPGETPQAIQISFKQDVYSVEVDSTVTVDVDVIPENAVITYTSSNTSVATVNQYGVVTGVSAGSATLIVTATLEGYETGTASCAINVTAKDEPVIGAYAIYGDLLNSHWNASPDLEKTPEYYLPYTASSDKVWTTTITIANEDTENSDWDTYGGWSASFCIVEYGDDSEEKTVVAGYSALDTANSTGVIGGDDESNHIQVYWRNEYTLTIDLSDLANPSITVTCLSEYDSAYALYGYFTEASWEDTPLLDSDLTLRYNSKDLSTQYWTATVTTPESTETWLAGFRIVKYGDYSTNVGTYSNLASNSPVNLGEGNDGNINLNWGTTYVITIDGTSGTLSISISEYSEGGDSGGSGGGDTGGGEITYDAAYALYGDFPDGYSWNESPSEDSIYYLPYSSSDKSTMYWEVTITIADPPTDNQYWDNPDTWDAGFRVVEYGTWNTVVGYSNIIGTPTGVKGTDNNDDIEVDFGSTFDLVIDCTGTSNTITVTLVSGTSGDEDEETYNINGYYVLYGDFQEGSWATTPDDDSPLILPYDSTNSNSKYWTRTVTTSSPSYTPGFRIINYGDTAEKPTVVAGYGTLNVDSASTGYNGYDSDLDLKFTATNTSYDLTIDMRGSTWTILIDVHVDGFEAGINGKAGGSSSGGSSSGETGDGLGLSNTYAMGMDTSSIVEVLEAGAVMYDYDGNKIDNIDDFMTFVASQGVNYIRIRLWLNPYDSYGNSYGGGHNDEETDLEIAEAAVKAGMKICLDFHYSDFWADRERQYCPSEWSSLTGTDLNNAAATYTTGILTDFMNAGCTPSMVQVGNETNNNSVSGTSGTGFFVACCNAVKTFDSNIKVVIHYADDQDRGSMASYFKALVNASCQFDIIGLSFYPFWHRNGSISTFQSDVEYFKSELSKDVCLMEYSYAFTTTWTDWGDTYGQMSNTFNDTLQAVAGYAATPEGQAQCIYDINKAVVSAGGIGSFYWESAWISKMGTCWASSYSAEFYTSHGVDVSTWNFDTCSWANQALFDYDGYVLSSFNIYNQMWGK